MALTQLASLLQSMPVLEAGSQEVALVAEELNSWAPVAAREKILLLMVQVRRRRGGGSGRVHVYGGMEQRRHRWEQH